MAVMVLTPVLLVQAVAVQVKVAASAVRVHVYVKLPAAQSLPQRPRAEKHQHQGDRELHPERNGLVNLKLQDDDHDARREERSRVTQAPECADERRLTETLVLADNRRDGDQVVRVERVPDSQDEP